MSAVYLGLGSNVGDRRAHLEAALKLLNEKSVRVVKSSSIYLTAAIGTETQDDFFNLVVKAETDLLPDELMQACLEVETALGRERTYHWGPRIIDIDILLYEDINVKENRLEIPHPRLSERRFVLEPLYEIEPLLVLPVGKSLSELLKQPNISEQEVKVYADGILSIPSIR